MIKKLLVLVLFVVVPGVACCGFYNDVLRGAAHAPTVVQSPTAYREIFASPTLIIDTPIPPTPTPDAALIALATINAAGTQQALSAINAEFAIVRIEATERKRLDDGDATMVSKTETAAPPSKTGTAAYQATSGAAVATENNMIVLAATMTPAAAIFRATAEYLESQEKYAPLRAGVEIFVIAACALFVLALTIYLIVSLYQHYKPVEQDEETEEKETRRFVESNETPGRMYAPILSPLDDDKTRKYLGYAINKDPQPLGIENVKKATGLSEKDATTITRFMRNWRHDPESGAQVRFAELVNIPETGGQVLNITDAGMTWGIAWGLFNPPPHSEGVPQEQPPGQDERENMSDSSEGEGEGGSEAE